MRQGAVRTQAWHPRPERHRRRRDAGDEAAGGGRRAGGGLTVFRSRTYSRTVWHSRLTNAHGRQRKLGFNSGASTPPPAAAFAFAATSPAPASSDISSASASGGSCSASEKLLGCWPVRLPWILGAGDRPFGDARRFGDRPSADSCRGPNLAAFGTCAPPPSLVLNRWPFAAAADTPVPRCVRRELIGAAVCADTATNGSPAASCRPIRPGCWNHPPGPPSVGAAEVRSASEK